VEFNLKINLGKLMQPTLFENTTSPLAFSSRPKTFEEFVGQEEIFLRFPFLLSKTFPSIIFFGPPGSGKTTLAHLLAENSDKDIYLFNAVLGGVADLKKLIQNSLEVKESFGKESIIFIDEIHRFNKAQQDALLPHVEKGSFTLIGATTENPRSSINPALLSRIQIIPLKKLSEDNVLKILENTCKKNNISVCENALETLADYSHGDARTALNILEIITQSKVPLDLVQIRSIILENAREYDKNKNRHYDIISAFIKSLRGSNPDAALLYLAIMLDGGEDPVFIARRLVIFASEDIGNADPSALTLATSALLAVSNIGMPEARINLAQATTYLASTVKSNASYKAIDAALEYVSQNPTIEIPDHLKNYPPKGTKPYLYPHDYRGHYIKQEYTKEKIPKFYQPSDMGREKLLGERLKCLLE
jgi:putative ATPase